MFEIVYFNQLSQSYQNNSVVLYQERQYQIIFQSLQLIFCLTVGFFLSTNIFQLKKYYHKVNQKTNIIGYNQIYQNQNILNQNQMAEELVFPYSNRQSDESINPKYENQLKSSGSTNFQNQELNRMGSLESKCDKLDLSQEENIIEQIKQIPNLKQVKSKKNPKRIKELNIIQSTNNDKNQESQINSTPNQSFTSQSNSIFNLNSPAQDLDQKLQNINENVDKIEDNQIQKNGLYFSDFPDNDKYTCILEDQLHKEDKTYQQTYSIIKEDKKIVEFEELNNDNKTFQTKQEMQDNKFFYSPNVNFEPIQQIKFNKKLIQDKKQYYKPSVKQQQKQKEQYQRNFQLPRVNNSTNSSMNQNMSDFKINCPDFSNIELELSSIIQNKAKTQHNNSIYQLNQINFLNQSIKFNHLNQISTCSKNFPSKMPQSSQAQKTHESEAEKKQEIEIFVKGKFEYSANNLIEVKEQKEQKKQEIFLSKIPLKQPLQPEVKKMLSNPQSLNSENSFETKPSIFQRQVSLDNQNRDNIESIQKSKMWSVGGIDSFTATQENTDSKNYNSLFSQWGVFNMNINSQYKRTDDFKFDNQDKLKSFFNFDSDQD